MYIRLIALAGLLGIVTAMSGCNTTSPEWGVALRNQGDQRVVDSRVRVGGRHYAPGILPSKATNGFHCDRDELPSAAVIKWQRDDGKWHEKSISLAPIAPLPGDGCVYLDISDENDVSLSYRRD